ncbi:MAG: hypothetical protein R3B12_00310 [Candidatus Saccharimonadales bacterium]
MKQLTQAIQTSVKHLYGIDITNVDLTRPDTQFGDYATNTAMQLANQLKQPPRHIADALVADITYKNYPWLASLSVAGPGFINAFLSDDFIFKNINPVPDKVLADKVVYSRIFRPKRF